MRFFASGFFHESVPPPPSQSVPLGPFQIFSKICGDSQVKVHHWCQRHRRQNCRRYQQHRRQICHRFQQHQRQILPPVLLVLLIPVVNLPPVSKITAANLLPVSGAWGKLIHEKNQRSRISWHCPFKSFVQMKLGQNNFVNTICNGKFLRISWL